MHALSERKKFGLFLGLVLAVHCTFLASQFKMEFSKITFKPEEDAAVKVMKVTFMPSVKPEATTLLNKQIVRSEDAPTNEKPVDQAFLSDKDRKFDRQTMAQNVDKFNKAARGNSAQTKVASKSETPAAPKKEFKDLKLSDFGMQPQELKTQEITRAPASESLQGLENGSDLSKGLSATNDYVEEMAMGDFTHLNTVEFKYFGFYNRIREKLEQFWGNSIQEKAANIFRAGRRIPASENLITSLQITLNAKGEIIGVKILGASGVKELDDAAVESFNLAGPFPNPPKDMLVNGKAVIEWGFVVKS